MYCYNPQDPHPVNRNNCALPLRQSPDDHVCGDLHAVEVRHLDFNAGGNPKGSISSNSDRPSESDTNTLPLCPKTSSVSNIVSESAASPAAGGASERCICLEYIGDNGPCPVHGTRGGAK